MKHYIEKVVTEKKKVLTHVTCNKCGHTSEIDENGFVLNMFQEVNFSFGYGSKYDMEDWEFHLCEDCVDELVKSFKHVPEGMESYTDYRSQMTQEEFEEWKSN